MGRPKKDVDEAKVAELAMDGCSSREIADILDLDEGTIRKRFSAMVRKERAKRRHVLRKAQFETARAGNVGMLVWLGKQELDQADKPETVVEATSGGGETTFKVVIGGKREE